MPKHDCLGFEDTDKYPNFLLLLLFFFFLKFSLSLLGCLPCWGLWVFGFWSSHLGFAVWSVIMGPSSGSKQFIYTGLHRRPLVRRSRNKGRISNKQNNYDLDMLHKLHESPYLTLGARVDRLWSRKWLYLPVSPFFKR